MISNCCNIYKKEKLIILITLLHKGKLLKKIMYFDQIIHFITTSQFIPVISLCSTKQTLLTDIHEIEVDMKIDFSGRKFFYILLTRFSSFHLSFKSTMTNKKITILTNMKSEIVMDLKACMMCLILHFIYTFISFTCLTFPF